ncbi:hypothetical protein [Pseudomonas sp. NFACC37-1]|uniref:hypothetical protein n=1 Tax=Pseudomonas sp. NFACC37-1 TaxID=1566196 RepID=UPI00088EA57F|nr:hypothetical protein [Pseudomonas sp. NFACC37-1]SCY35402.1 hypothetical protein SAMN03159391_01596 [Pseudomonas sp. NFACC37-1]
MKDLADKIFERNELLAKQVTKILEAHAPVINSFAQQFGQWLTQIQTNVAPYLEKIAQVDWQAVQERIENMPTRSKEAMIKASEQGWFFNWNNSFSDVWSLIDSLQDANSDEVDNILKAHYLNDMDWYVSELKKAFPDRAQAINAAINAHKICSPEGYYLSIPVFLAQADGILSEVTGTPSAMDKVRDGSELKGSAWVQAQIGDNQELKNLLYQLLNLHTMDILKSKKIRDQESLASGKTFNALNRHQVLHGEISNYGTELNSLKAFSFLAFTGLHIPCALRSPYLVDIEPSI